MSGEHTSEDERRTLEESAARRRRLAEVFGDVLPETTSDERDTEAPTGRSGDDWLRDQVPPHHGG